MFFLRVLLPLVGFSLVIVNAAPRVICYYESGKATRGIVPEDLDATLCTHINYAFIGLADDGTLTPNNVGLDINQGLYSRTVGMKDRNPNLKVLLSVGGGDGTSPELFAAIAADPNKRNNMIRSAVDLCQTYGFDGLDIDWEYPEANDRDNFISLLREFREAFNPYGYLLTAAVNVKPHDGYDMVQMNTYLDIINLMTYDMYGSWSGYTGQNSPLYASSIESENEKKYLNIHSASHNWVDGGASKEKLAVGVAFYGRSFTLADPNQHGLHAPITGAGVDRGEPTYIDICSKYIGDWTRVWDDEQKNPYLYSGDQWIGYDDGDSIWIKGNYVRDEGFGGVMIWPVDGDDVYGDCGEKQLLLRNLNQSIQ